MNGIKDLDMGNWKLLIKELGKIQNRFIVGLKTPEPADQ